MNELDHLDDEACDRCQGPLSTQRYTVNIDADPPLDAPIEVWICDGCMESLTRWMQRRQSSPRSRDVSLAPETSRRARSKGGRRSRYTAVLDREEAWHHRKRRLLVGTIFATIATLLGLIYFVVVSDALKAFRRD
jgi:hypothetical protein